MSHTGEKVCLTVNALITHKDKVLLVFHKDYQTWFPPGGHVEKEEDPETAVYREIVEETGLTKNELTPIENKFEVNENIFSDMSGRILLSPLYSDIHTIGPNREHVGLRFFFKSTKEIVVSSDDDTTEIRWFTIEELNGHKYNLRKHVIFYGEIAIRLSA